MAVTHDEFCPTFRTGDGPYCCCAELVGARKETAQQIERSITTYANSLTGKREQGVALTCASLAVSS